MFCKMCGSEVSDDSVFCSKCGTNIKESKTQQGTDTKDTVVDTCIGTPKFQSAVNSKALLNGLCEIFIGVLAVWCGFSIDSIFASIVGGVLAFVGVLVLATCKYNTYEIVCPYCNKTISAVDGETAMDCPVCKERIIIENYRPKRK